MKERLNQLENITLLKEIVAKEEGKRDILIEQLNKNNNLLSEIKEQIELLEEVTLLFQKHLNSHENKQNLK